MAEPNDDLQQPLIEIITEEKPYYVVASIVINYTLAKQYVTNGLTEMNSIRMGNSLNQQLKRWNKHLPVSWSQFCIKVNKNSFHRFVTTQMIVEKFAKDDAQCSFVQAKMEKWC